MSSSPEQQFKFDVQEFEQKFQHIAESAPATIVVLDQNHCIAYISKLGDGFDRQQVIGTSVYDFATSETTAQQRKVLDEVYSKGKVGFYHSEVPIPTGDIRWYETQASPVVVNKQIVGAVLFSSDITHTKLIENELRTSEQKFRSIAENAPSMIFICDSDLNITYINRVFPGFKKEDILNTHFSSYVRKSHHEMMTAKLKAVFEKGKKYRFEVEGTGPEGHVRWYANTAGPIVSNGQVEAVIVVANDVTEQKLAREKEKEFNRQLEEMVSERTEQLEQANEEIKVLLKEMHHRVKNNLQIISSLLNIQMSTLEDGVVRQELKEAQDRIKSMSIIHETLYQKDQLSEINVGEYLERLVHDRIAANAIKHTVDFKIDAGMHYFDVDIMVPIGLLMNELVTNSLKHAFPNGQDALLTIKLSQLQGNNFQIEYSDNGVGLVEKEPVEENGMKSLGMELLECFVDQLDATYTRSSSDKGLKYVIDFSV